MSEVENAAHQGGGAEVDVDILPREVRRELDGLSESNRNHIESLLAQARVALEDDPDLAMNLTQEAVKSAGRLPVVREAAGVAAYHAGDYALAKKELQAARRISGRSDMLALIADCERGLGHPERAIDLWDSADGRKLRGAPQAELIMVVAGARRDLGQPGEAELMLETACEHSPPAAAWTPRLYYAFADVLAANGKNDLARDWFARCALADSEGELDADERIAEIDGGSD